MKGSLLFCVLNWGLGHASRCVPLIRDAQGRGFEVVIASDGEALSWLQSEFPQAESLELPSYRIRYGAAGNSLLTYARLLPSIYRATMEERKVIARFVRERQLAGIISDNRLGCRHPDVPSVYLSHQTKVLAGRATWWSTRAHRYFYRKYDAIAIPDRSDHFLSGELSTLQIKKPTFYLGPLSRFKRNERREQKGITVVLSGPEPQKSAFEKLVIHQAEALQQPVHIVGTKAQKAFSNGRVNYFPTLGSKALYSLLADSELVVSRSGYSSLMDYAALGSRALLVPTPGQYEQEYLAALHHQRGHFYTVSQHSLDLQRDIPLALEYPGITSGAQTPDFSDLFAFFEGK